MKTVGLGLGLVFGLVLTGAGLTSYDLIHQGLLLEDASMYLIMGSAVAIAAAGLWLLERIGWVTPFQGPLKIMRASLERKHIYGGILFGMGWAITGTCPAVSAAMLGSGTVYGGVVICGLLTGVFFFDVRRRSGNVLQPLPKLEEMIAGGVTTAIFDVDNTIAKCNIVDFYLFIERKRRMGWNWRLFFLTFVLRAPYYLVLNFISRELFARWFVNRKFQSFRYEELDMMAELFFQEELRHRLITSTCEFIAQLKARQIQVILLSTNYNLIVKRFGAYFDVPFICHKVINNGDHVIFDYWDLASFKERQIQSFPKNSIGVGDSKFDIPVLNHVTYPFVVANKPKSWFKTLNRFPWLLDPTVKKV
jgi:phosphoserine phosphatase